MTDALRTLYPQIVTTIGNVAYDANGAVVQYDATAVANLVKANAYKSERQTAYPAIGDQLDMLWHSIDAGTPLDKTSAFYTALSAVKTKYPKGA